MIPDDPLLFIGIFTITVVACNVLLAWSHLKLVKAISKLTHETVPEPSKETSKREPETARHATEPPLEEPKIKELPPSPTETSGTSFAISAEDLGELKKLISERRKTTAKKQPDASPPPSDEEDYIDWLNKMSKQ
jgi:hypothetical protein